MGSLSSLGTLGRWWGGVPCSEVGHTVAENESLLPGEEARTKEAV